MTFIQSILMKMCRHFSRKASLPNNAPGPKIAKSILSLAIIGRPNVGKSTLFNRLTGSRAAIVSDIPGTTRDRREGRGVLVGLPLHVVDTGGLDDCGAFTNDVIRQVVSAIEEADVVLFVVDARSGLNPLDMHYARWLRKTLGKIADKEQLPSRQFSLLNRKLSDDKVGLSRPVILLANKAEGDNAKLSTSLDSFRPLGLGEAVPISAAHGEGFADLFQTIEGLTDGYIGHEAVSSSMAGTLLHGVTEQEISVEDISLKVAPQEPTIQLAFMGRPNVGKSTLLNAVLGSERVIVGATPGLTRDAVRVEWSFFGRQMLLVDTAGLTHLTPDARLLCGDASVVSMVEKSAPRHLPGSERVDREQDPSQFSHRISEMSLVSALNALRCMLEGRALVVAANKADLLPQAMSRAQYEIDVRKHCAAFLPELGDLRVVCCVASKREGVNRLLHTVLEVHDTWSKRIDTWVLNSWFKDLMVAMPAARADGKPIKIKYITQVKSRPPTFALFSNTAVLPTFLERFLRARLQQDFSLHGVPLRFIVRKAEVPERYRQPKRQSTSEQEGGRTMVQGWRKGTATAAKSRSRTRSRRAGTDEGRVRVRRVRSSAAGPKTVTGRESVPRSRTARTARTVNRRRQTRKRSNK